MRLVKLDQLQNRLSKKLGIQIFVGKVTTLNPNNSSPELMKLVHCKTCYEFRTRKHSPSFQAKLRGIFGAKFVVTSNRMMNEDHVIVGYFDK